MRKTRYYRFKAVRSVHEGLLLTSDLVGSTDHGRRPLVVRNDNDTGALIFRWTLEELDEAFEHLRTD
jgi:hypothetical protein